MVVEVVHLFKVVVMQVQETLDSMDKLDQDLVGELVQILHGQKVKVELVEMEGLLPEVVEVVVVDTEQHQEIVEIKVLMEIQAQEQTLETQDQMEMREILELEQNRVNQVCQEMLELQEMQVSQEILELEQIQVNQEMLEQVETQEILDLELI
jgi:hypothetical protein